MRFISLFQQLHRYQNGESLYNNLFPCAPHGVLLLNKSNAIGGEGKRTYLNDKQHTYKKVS